MEWLLKIMAVAFIAGMLTGCMQLTGAKRIKMGSWEIESNAGFEVSAGAMQYDGANNLKTKGKDDNGKY